jgi:hypothetical protein
VKAVEKKRFKRVFCLEARLFDLAKRLAPVGTLALLRLANRERQAAV